MNKGKIQLFKYLTLIILSIGLVLILLSSLNQNFLLSPSAKFLDGKFSPLIMLLVIAFIVVLLILFIMPHIISKD